MSDGATKEELDNIELLRTIREELDDHLGYADPILNGILFKMDRLGHQLLVAAYRREGIDV